MKIEETKVAYISGPITGYKNLNRCAFEKAQKDLEKQSYIVVNPHEIGKELYIKWSKNLDELGYSWENIPASIQKKIWEDFMKNDIRHLTLCHVLFVLDGWETSKGARIEVYLAKTLGLKVYSIKNMLELEVDINLVKGKPMVL